MSETYRRDINQKEVGKLKHHILAADDSSKNNAFNTREPKVQTQT